MSLYDKIAEVQMELLKCDIEEKSGYHGKFMSLPSLLCEIVPKCYEKGLFFYFTANDTHLLLKIIDRETGGVLSPAPHVRLPVLGKDMKAEGGNYTYMKRYLLMNTFHAIADAWDPEDMEEGLPPEKNNNASSAKNKGTSKKSASSSANKNTNSNNDNAAETVSSELNIPSLVVEAESKLKSKGLDDNEITIQALKMQVLKQVRNVSERREINKYFQENYGEGSK